MTGSADSEANRAVVVVPRFEPRVRGYILHAVHRQMGYLVKRLLL
jgi:hypothetical protein